MNKQKAIRAFSGFVAAALFPLFLTGCGEKAGWSASLEKLYDPTTMTLAGLPWDSSISQVEETLKLDLGETALYQGGDTALFILPVPHRPGCLGTALSAVPDSGRRGAAGCSAGAAVRHLLPLSGG